MSTEQGVRTIMIISPQSAHAQLVAADESSSIGALMENKPCKIETYLVHLWNPHLDAGADKHECLNDSCTNCIGSDNNRSWNILMKRHQEIMRNSPLSAKLFVCPITYLQVDNLTSEPCLTSTLTRYRGSQCDESRSSK